MLHLLVDFLSGIIRILAAACIVAGTVYGYVQAPVMQVEPWVGGLIGFSAGFLVASLGGGLLACLILIENHLRVLADAQRRIDRAKPAPRARRVEEKPAEKPEPDPEPESEPKTTDYAAYRKQYAFQPRPPDDAASETAKAESGKNGKTDTK
ncbi:hypothetical protein K1W69_21140 [Hoeflea sp. WL0058]|uniref:Uncharacterized protein n=1 Tax=Flavimaribacter sediminis TaxID=2865987 RepID=A0AAE3D3J1_9HYPH|nr:hypothetical protein [Flavimaribacter sediminis]MBW8639713.1 hypothetical protein [Flavimaribacter sediminis]